MNSQSELLLFELLAQSEEDVREGRVEPIDGMFERVKDAVKEHK